MPEATPTNQKFNLIVPITGYTIRKDAKGVEKYVVTGLASNTNLDLTGERMADSAIDAMVKSLDTTKIYLNNEHGSDWDDDFGEVTKLWATDGHELMMEAELDPDHYRTKTLIKALDKGKKLGLSIGGYVKKAAMEWFEDAARMVMTYKDIALFHVAITGTPAVADTWVTPITKSVKDWKEMPMPNTQATKADETVETPVVQPAAETQPTAVVPDDTAGEAPVETPVAEAPEAPATTDTEPPAQDDPTTEPVADTVTPEETPKPEEAPEAPATEKSEANIEAPATPEPDTTETSDVTEDQPSAEPTPDPEPASTPAEPEAPDQKDEAPASAETAPAPADEGTSEVAKSAAFGDWAEIGLVMESVERLSWVLQDYIWSAMANDAFSSQEKMSAIAFGLDDFRTLMMKVVAALIESGNTEEVQRAAEAFRANTPEALNKSISERDTKVEELTKAVSAKEDEIGTLQKSLEEKETELTTKATELAEATTKIETFEARKGIVFDKFTGADNTTEKDDRQQIALEAQRKFAGFIFNGPEAA